MNAADSVATAAAATVTVASNRVPVINMLRSRTASVIKITKIKEEVGKFGSKRYYVLQLCNINPCTVNVENIVSS